MVKSMHGGLLRWETLFRGRHACRWTRQQRGQAGSHTHDLAFRCIKATWGFQLPSQGDPRVYPRGVEGHSGSGHGPHQKLLVVNRPRPRAVISDFNDPRVYPHKLDVHT